MSDLAVKLFMAANNLDDFDVASGIMYKYGLAEPYESAATGLQPLLTEDGEEGFREGAEFVQEVFRGLRFQLPTECQGSEFARGIQFAMQQADALIQAAVDGARMSDEDVERETRIHEASILPLDVDSVMELVSSFFDNRREPTKG